MKLSVVGVLTPQKLAKATHSVSHVGESVIHCLLTLESSREMIRTVPGVLAKTLSPKSQTSAPGPGLLPSPQPSWHTLARPASPLVCQPALSRAGLTFSAPPVLRPDLGPGLESGVPRAGLEGDEQRLSGSCCRWHRARTACPPAQGSDCSGHLGGPGPVCLLTSI